MIPFIALAGTIALFAIAALVTWAFRDWQFARDLDREVERWRDEQVAKSRDRYPSTHAPTPGVRVTVPNPHQRRLVRACDLRPGDVLYPSRSKVLDLPWPMPDGSYRVPVTTPAGVHDLVTLRGGPWENVEVLP